jgi:5-guanidino-2-oxopentanoate decarboxylase
LQSTEHRNVASALIDLLADYGVDLVFGIPGVHTLEFYRHLSSGPIKHIVTRHEQGAAFMADGHARVSGKPGVALVISGPGVTNSVTALAQAYADSIPLLLISTVNRRETLGQGWGLLHDLTDQDAVTQPMTDFSVTAKSVDEVPDLIARAFSHFHSRRPRPVHISIPLDLLVEPVSERWRVQPAMAKPEPDENALDSIAEQLMQAKSPLILVGGGAKGCSEELTAIAEQLQAPVLSSKNGKGILPDLHPLHLPGTLNRVEGRSLIDEADRVLVVGSELAESENYGEGLELGGKLLRIDIEPARLPERYPALVAVCADAVESCQYLRSKLEGHHSNLRGNEIVARLREQIETSLTLPERRHLRVLKTLRKALPEDCLIMADATQLVYSGMFGMPVDKPGLWHYPAGFLTLGSALPCAIGAKLALPNRPVVAIVGDGGFLFTLQELLTAAEQQLPLVIILWNNNSLKQIKDDMQADEMETLAVDNLNPDFSALVQSCRCLWQSPKSHDELFELIKQGLLADKPTVVEINEFDNWIGE